MRLCASHAEDAPDPERARRRPPQAEGPRGEGGRDAVGAASARGTPHRGSAHPRGDARAPALAASRHLANASRGHRAGGAGSAVIVVDASAILELVLDTHAALLVADRVLLPGEVLHAPHLLDVEVASAMRRYVAAREVGEAKAAAAIDDLLALPIERHPHALLLRRAWELRRSISSYDAMYVALAEALDAPLVTRDARLARSH